MEKELLCCGKKSVMYRSFYPGLIDTHGQGNLLSKEYEAEWALLVIAFLICPITYSLMVRMTFSNLTDALLRERKTSCLKRDRILKLYGGKIHYPPPSSSEV